MCAKALVWELSGLNRRSKTRSACPHHEVCVAVAVAQRRVLKPLESFMRVVEHDAAHLSHDVGFKAYFAICWHWRRQ